MGDVRQSPQGSNPFADVDKPRQLTDHFSFEQAGAIELTSCSHDLEQLKLYIVVLFYLQISNADHTQYMLQRYLMVANYDY
jgi:hypothetical protein